jgi:phosphoglycolate phosphatase
MAVVSNKVDSAVKELCERYFNGYFEVTVGEREGVRRKPSPDAVLAAINILNTKTEHAVYIGDSEVDIETARNSDMDFIAVSWGFRERHQLSAIGNFTIADTAEELLALFFN